MHRNVRRAAIAAALFQMFTSSAAHAADDAAIVVTGTRQQMRAAESLSDLSVVTREDIQRAGQSTLAELLQTQPGLEISSTGGPGQPATVFMRGANGAHTLVLIDGMRVGSATLGTTAFEHLPLAAIDRIEILRGPASSLYGSDAIGGVIQIFTKRGSGPIAPNFSLGYGTYDTWQGSAGIGGQTEGGRFSLQAGFVDTKGFNAITNDQNFAYNKDRDGYRNTNFSGSFALNLAQGHELGGNALYSDGTTQKDALQCDPFFFACTTDYDSKTRQTVQSGNLYLRNQFTKIWASTLRIGQSTDDMADQRLDPSTNREFKDTFRTTQDQVVWQNDVTAGPGKLLLAAEQLKQRIASTNAYPVTQRTINSLLAGYQGWFDKHGIQVNLRGDSNSQFGDETTGGISYGYQFTPAWRLMLGARSAFKAPTFNDLYFPASFFGAGNPKLQPEHSQNREGALVYDTPRQRLSLTLYRNEVRDLIDWVETPPGSWFYTPTNVNRALLTGATLAGSATFGNWQLRGNLDFQDPRDQTTDKLLVNRAQHYGTLGADYRAERWQVGGEVVGSGVRYDDQANTITLGGYGIVNLHGQYAIDKGWNLFARANNVFDKRYELRRDYATAGANVFVGVRYEPQ
ncbi:TonB-dependent receptor domain-containing protein [Sulfurisoma sediminicola]|uniref:Vitamin B12 transporter n=1 Tax=Sulfurisoma sediminicola TaxID=1381557 RepID=A0A497XK51_9PROT|nr:TonB-dependent receptor [Sulfurisoma sediminicola]RLJ68332.1 vitamin B12 transporter [Sulfurisoma sediminicola]